MSRAKVRVLAAGERFGRLVVVERGDLRSGNRLWRLRCDCGAEHQAAAFALFCGRVKSCGCLNDEVRIERNTTHGHAHRAESHPLYARWQAMIARCHRPSHADFGLYGARGISVCDRWRHDFQAYLDDVGTPTPGRPTLDRIDNEGNYEPGNVRWATWSEQRLNQRNARAPRNAARHLAEGKAPAI